MAVQGRFSKDNYNAWRCVERLRVTGFLGFGCDMSWGAFVLLVSSGEGLMCTNMIGRGTDCLGLRNYNEATGVIRPRHIHGDKCRCPRYLSLLRAVLGVGTQQFIIHLQYSWDQIMQYGQSIDDSETTSYALLITIMQFIAANSESCLGQGLLVVRVSS
ncbi:hypothetical protein SO802_008801 [Lithocarpus litseifolius]|uniref:Uncharacterized protein n=1 Tax=Lithocarpus litseifolius TaxID=425828 RepID=A0AAW2DCG6_9ROSI